MIGLRIPILHLGRFGGHVFVPLPPCTDKFRGMMHRNMGRMMR